MKDNVIVHIGTNINLEVALNEGSLSYVATTNKIKIHEKYGLDPLPEYDFAILTLPDLKGFKCDGCYETACLPTKPLKGNFSS